MSIAEKIFNETSDWNERIEKANALFIEDDQGWDEEKTTFIFDDYSMIVFQNSDVWVEKPTYYISTDLSCWEIT